MDGCMDGWLAVWLAGWNMRKPQQKVRKCRVKLGGILRAGRD